MLNNLRKSETNVPKISQIDVVDLSSFAASLWVPSPIEDEFYKNLHSSKGGGIALPVVITCATPDGIKGDSHE